MTIVFQIIHFGTLFFRQVKADGSTSDVDVNFDLLWSATTPVFDFDTDMDTNAMVEAIACEPWSQKFFTNLKK